LEEEMEKQISENGIVYALGEDRLYYPDLELSEDKKFEIGKFGRMRAEYVMENNVKLYHELIMEGRWNEYLHDVDEECNKQMDSLVKCMMEKEGVTEKMKAENQMKWVRKVNGIRIVAEEIVVREWICVR
jgi:hypothetical protein